MSDNIVTISNTPIFDQLARERNYDRLVAGGPTVRLRPDDNCFISTSAWIAKPVPQLTPSVRGRNAKLTVNYHPTELSSWYENHDAFVEARKKEFARKHPNAVDVVMTMTEEFDGSCTLTIEGYENTGITLAKLPVWEPRTSLTPKELKGVQMILQPSMKIDQGTVQTGHASDVPLTYDSMVEAIIKYDPEQTDESVNAASTDVTPRPQYAGPRPLWFAKDDADEE